MKKILCLIDFSDASVNAMDYLLQLYHEQLSTFYLLHVKETRDYISDDLYINSKTSIYNSVVKHTKEKLNKLIALLENQYKDEPFYFDAIVDYDLLTDSVNQIVSKKNISLVVMGANGVTGTLEAIFGSNTINVIRYVNCSTFIVPEGFIFTQPKYLLLALDGTDTLKETATKNLLEFVHQHKLELKVYRITPEKQDDLEKQDATCFRDEIESKLISYNTMYDVPFEFAVDSIVQTTAVDMICLFVQHEAFIERLLFGSPTKEITDKLRLPLLIYHI